MAQGQSLKENRNTALALSLGCLAEATGKVITATTLPVYAAVMADMSREQCILAFSRATDELRYWPSPAQLRELGGIAASGDPVEAAARAALDEVFAAMREFGPALNPKRGAVMRTTGDDGRMLIEPERAQDRHAELAGPVVMALVRLGWGDQQKGLALLSDHPALAGAAFTSAFESPYRQNLLKLADELEKRFILAYRQAVEAH